jgi:hypothetical protein
METTSSASTRAPRFSRGLPRTPSSSTRRYLTSRSSRLHLIRSHLPTPRRRFIWIWITQSLRSETVIQSEGCVHISPQSEAHISVLPSTSSTDVWIDDTHLNVTYDTTWGASVNPQIQDQYFNLTFQYATPYLMCIRCSAISYALQFH